MSKIYERIRTRRLELGLTIEELAQKMGYRDKSSISKIENGKSDIPQSKVIAFAKALNTTTAYLIGAEENPAPPSCFQPMPSTTKVPRVGRIACGEPILAEENIADYDSVPDSWHASFTLLCVGDSMAPKIMDGDLVAIRQQPEVENGQIAAVLIDKEATLKRIYHYPDKLVLSPENPNYEPIVLVKDEISSVRIEGRAVGICRKI